MRNGERWRDQEVELSKEIARPAPSGAQNAALADLILSADRVAVLRFPLGGSCAVPLSITHPESAELLTWAFTGFSEEAAGGPVCLLVLGARSGAGIFSGGSVTLQTHVRDVSLILNPASTNTRLSPSEASVLVQAVLTALNPATVERVAALLPLLVSPLGALPHEPDGPELTLNSRSAEATVTAMDFIPAYVVARSSGSYLCLPVRAVRIRATPRRAMTLAMDLPGREEAALDRAIFVGDGRYAVASRIAKA